MSHTTFIQKQKKMSHKNKILRSESKDTYENSIRNFFHPYVDLRDPIVKDLVDDILIELKVVPGISKKTGEPILFIHFTDSMIVRIGVTHTCRRLASTYRFEEASEKWGEMVKTAISSLEEGRLGMQFDPDIEAIKIYYRDLEVWIGVIGVANSKFAAADF